MKRLALLSIPENPNTPVLFEKPNEKIYGFSFFEQRGWIEASEFDKKRFTLRAVQDMNNHNIWMDKNLTLDEVKKFLNEESIKIFRFDTPQELLRWLSQERKP